MNAYDVAIERFGDAIIEHYAMALDALDALHWTAQSHAHPTGSTSWVARVAEIRLLFPAEWVEIRRFFEENEERMGVMRLYAAFEARIKRDGNWRALTPTACFHDEFSDLRGDKAFVSVRAYLNRWQAVWPKDPQHPHAGLIDALHTLFTDERNPLMHDDQSLVPPIQRVQSQLAQAIHAFIAIAPDFAISSAE